MFIFAISAFPLTLYSFHLSGLSLDMVIYFTIFFYSALQHYHEFLPRWQSLCQYLCFYCISVPKYPDSHTILCNSQENLLFHSTHTHTHTLQASSLAQLSWMLLRCCLGLVSSLTRDHFPTEHMLTQFDDREYISSTSTLKGHSQM